ncbi:NTE family protein [Keratinibaculum paraultunense]|uniref:NTE family protein n=2 Tax=Keratinibaculum paraultunense TaxID=1278232 RepID=A0A4R3KVT8_9FIRM|nr:NTE family protein [Keratinibaculum paraultunense]
MYGLVLEGGGAKGAYHIGAYKAILEEGIEIGGVAGTSVGALNGAILVQGDYEKAYELWYNISYSKVINVHDEYIERLKEGKFSKEDLILLAEKIKGVFSEKGLDITPLKNLLMEFIDEHKIRNSGKDFGIVTVSLSDLKPLEVYIEDIPEGKLIEYLMASAYLPIFKRERIIDGKIYLDGALYNNLPVNLLIDKGYKDLILVRTHGIGNIKKVPLEGLNTITIAPNEDLGKLLDFDCDTARKNLKLGYYDGLKALRGLKGDNYYIEGTKKEDYFVDYLWSLDEDKVLKMAEIFKIDKDIPYRRALFEFIIPKISNILGMDKKATYEDIYYRLLERLAEIYEIDRFNIYTDEELLDLIKNKLLKEEYTKGNGIEKIIEKVNLLPLFNKDEIIKEVGKVLFNIF